MRLLLARVEEADARERVVRDPQVAVRVALRVQLAVEDLDDRDVEARRLAAAAEARLLAFTPGERAQVQQTAEVALAWGSSEAEAAPAAQCTSHRQRARCNCG